jgi:hypothetical protein
MCEEQSPGGDDTESNLPASAHEWLKPGRTLQHATPFPHPLSRHSATRSRIDWRLAVPIVDIQGKRR